MPRMVDSFASSTVLLVEEDPIVRKSLVRALASEGFEISGTDVGAKMEAALEGRSFQAVLVSVEGEEWVEERAVKDGSYRRRAVTPDWNRIRRIRSLHPDGRLVALTVTAPAHPMAGVDAVVEKPVAVQHLVSILRQLLQIDGEIGEDSPSPGGRH